MQIYNGTNLLTIPKSVYFHKPIKLLVTTIYDVQQTQELQ